MVHRARRHRVWNPDAEAGVGVAEHRPVRRNQVKTLRKPAAPVEDVEDGAAEPRPTR